MIKKLLKIEELIQGIKPNRKTNDENIKLINKCIDDLFKIANDEKTNIEDYDKINRLINKATYKLYQL